MTKLSDPVTARYQREAANGSRPTFGTKMSHASETPHPSAVRPGTAKVIKSRKNAAQGKATREALQARKLKVLKAKAFEALGLTEDATPQDIRGRYKDRLKMHHPDVNQGDRNSEEDLRATIDTYKILKLNGFC